jgi:hypothetical protein
MARVGYCRHGTYVGTSAGSGCFQCRVEAEQWEYQENARKEEIRCIVREEIGEVLTVLADPKNYPPGSTAESRALGWNDAFDYIKGRLKL